MTILSRLKALFRKPDDRPTEQQLTELARGLRDVAEQQSVLIKELLGNNQKLLDQNRELLAEVQSWRAVMRAKL